jgi:acyl carrier protein
VQFDYLCGVLELFATQISCMKNVEFNLFKLVHEEFQIAYEDLSEQTLFRNFDTWGSLSALIFISAISEQTGVYIASNDLANWQTLADIQSFIDSKKNG